MAAIVTTKFRFLQASQFRKAFDASGEDRIYLGISKPTPWADELEPEFPVDLGTSDAIDTREWLAAKRVNYSDTAFCIPRYNWVAGTIYTPYSDNDPNLYMKEFYVLTDEYKLYKCIHRPSPTSQSTVKPTTTLTTGFETTPDGYVWKYMLSITPAEAARYITNLWIPIKALTAEDNSGSNQWSVMQNATPGTIDYATVENFGTSYVNPTVTIEGDGTGATAVISTLEGGEVKYVSITNPGSGYTWARINIVEQEGQPGNGAVVRPVISPRQGHGYNVAEELGGFYVMINMILNYEEAGKFPKFNDYRKLFLTRNPTLYGTETIATDSVYNCSTNLTFTSVSGEYYPDEEVTSSAGSTARVVEYDAENRILSLTMVDGTFALNDTVNGANGAVGIGVTNVDTPDLDPYNGSILYKDYRRYVNRDPNQFENVVIVIEF